MDRFFTGAPRAAEAVRRAIQHSQESLRTLAQRHGFHPKTIARWRKRSSVAGRRTEPRPTVLSLQQEAVAVAFRRHTLLPRGRPGHDPYRAHRQRRALHGARRSLGPQPPKSSALARGELFRAHAFEFACVKADIDHRLAKPKHPWTNGQVERMNRTPKEPTVRRFDDENLRRHLKDFVAASNFARRLKTLKGLTPYEYIRSLWTKEPQPFTPNPHYLSAGPYS